MHYADSVGLDKVYAAMQKYRARYGDLYWTPAPLLERLAKSGQTFAQWSASRG
ncbi:MAG: 3-hydroxyacyl-CoA dehydrogenase family protein [Gammaproteobacteria bacterium]